MAKEKVLTKEEELPFPNKETEEIKVDDDKDYGDKESDEIDEVEFDDIDEDDEEEEEIILDEEENEDDDEEPFT